MGRKGTLEKQRADIRRQYLRGKKADVKVLQSDTSLSDIEREIKQTLCCYFKAQDFSYTYMAEALGVSKPTIQSWFSNEELGLAAKVKEIRDDLVSGAVKMMKTYLLEIVEVQMEIIRTTLSDELASKIGFELMDRLGITKINKSDSTVAKTLRTEGEVDIVDRTGMLKLAKNAPPHVQAKMAEAMETIIGLGAEYGGITGDEVGAPDA